MTGRKSAATGARGQAESATAPLRYAAQRLGIGLRAARKAAAAGSIPAIQVNGRWYVLVEPFEALLQDRTRSRGGAD